MKNKIKCLVDDFLMANFAGLSISIGCIAFLSSSSKVVGALFFAVGLFMICNFKFNLFTGKVCYVFSNKPSYIFRLIVIWIGNFVGATVVALMVKATRLSSLQINAQNIASVKMSDSLLSLFILGILCNILIYLAVEGYSKFENSVARFSALIFGVSVFVLCGFEHCVADMFYFIFSGSWTPEMLLRIMIITLGNIVGGLVLPLAMLIKSRLNNNSKNL